MGLDNYKGTFLATLHLGNTDCKKIALVTLESGQTQITERLDGYLAALKEFQLEPIILKVAFKNEAETTVIECIKLIRDNPGLDAILFTTNYLALSGIKAIQELGLNMPNDISVIAFDDHDVFPIYNPPISAVVQPMELLSQALFNTLLGKLDNLGIVNDFTRISIQPELKLRGSTR